MDLHKSLWTCAPGPAACAGVRLLCGQARGRKVALPRKPRQEEQGATSALQPQVCCCPQHSPAPAAPGAPCLEQLLEGNEGIRKGVLCTQGNVLFLQDHKQNPERAVMDPAALGRPRTAGTTSFMEHFPGVQ